MMKKFKYCWILCIVVCYSCKKNIPDTPGTISGPVEPFVGSKDVVYSVLPVDNSNYYLWSIPENTTIVSGQGTTSIKVNIGYVDGKICVRSNNNHEYSEKSCLQVKAIAAPVVVTNLTAMVWTNSETNGSINVYIDDVFKGTVSSYYLSTPSCGATGCVSVTVSSGSHKFYAISSTGSLTWGPSYYTVSGACYTWCLL